MGWGCTIRVGQMLIVNTLLRHLMIRKDFKYRKTADFNLFRMHERLTVNEYMVDPEKKKIYLNVLAQVLDDELPEEKIRGTAKYAKPLQAFRLNNISKMALATQNILPGTWLGVGQVAHILCHLNRLFRPLCDDFQICVLNDGNVLFERIARKM